MVCLERSDCTLNLCSLSSVWENSQPASRPSQFFSLCQCRIEIDTTREMFTCMKISPSMSEFLHLTESALFSHTQSVKVFFSDAKLVKSSPSEAFLQFPYSLFFQLVRTFREKVHFDLPQQWLVLCSFCVRLHHFSMLVMCSDVLSDRIQT